MRKVQALLAILASLVLLFQAGATTALGRDGCSHQCGAAVAAQTSSNEQTVTNAGGGTGQQPLMQQGDTKSKSKNGGSKSGTGSKSKGKGSATGTKSASKHKDNKQVGNNGGNNKENGNNQVQSNQSNSTSKGRGSATGTKSASKHMGNNGNNNQGQQSNATNSSSKGRGSATATKSQSKHPAAPGNNNNNAPGNNAPGNNADNNIGSNVGGGNAGNENAGTAQPVVGGVITPPMNNQQAAAQPQVQASRALAGVQTLPSTSTDSNAPAALLGVLLIGSGVYLLRRPQRRMR
jgi:LPXTG-motif cell wall-anchored protein